MVRTTLTILLLFALSACGTGISEITLTGVCDAYPEASTSPYVVPWPSGTSQKVDQGNCGPASHYGSSKYAYDFSMPIGTNIVATRAGVVLEVVEDRSDGNGCSSGENHVYIIHADGTVAQYLHLTQNGSLVAVGDSVTQGQVIALSGNSGCSAGPHLHFEVVANADSNISIPVTFSNVGTNKRGLQPGKTYTAQ